MRTLTPDGELRPSGRAVANETPVAVEYNGLGYAVLMASGHKLVDLGYGFAQAERLILGQQDIREAETHLRPTGTILRVTLAEHCLPTVVERVRHRVSGSSCDLCGIENLDQAILPLPPLPGRSDADAAAIFRALVSLAQAQPINAATGQFMPLRYVMHKVPSGAVRA